MPSLALCFQNKISHFYSNYDWTVPSFKKLSFRTLLGVGMDLRPGNLGRLDVWGGGSRGRSEPRTNSFCRCLLSSNFARFPALIATTLDTFPILMVGNMIS